MRFLLALLLLFPGMAWAQPSANLSVQVVSSQGHGPPPPPPSGCSDPDNSAAALAGTPLANAKCDTASSMDFDKSSDFTANFFSVTNFTAGPMTDGSGYTCNIQLSPPIWASDGVHNGYTVVSGTPPNATFNIYQTYLTGVPNDNAGFVGDWYIETKRKVTNVWGDTDNWVEEGFGEYAGQSNTGFGFNYPEGTVSYNYLTDYSNQSSQEFDGSTYQLDTGKDLYHALFDGNWHTAGVSRINGVYSVWVDGVLWYAMSGPPYPPNGTGPPSDPGPYNYPFNNPAGVLSYWAAGTGVLECPQGPQDSAFAYSHFYHL